MTPYGELWNTISSYFYPSPQILLLKQSDFAGWGKGSLLQNCSAYVMFKSLKIHVNLHAFKDAYIKHLSGDKLIERFIFGGLS